MGAVAKNNRGTENFRAKLTEQEVREVYLSDENQLKLALKYGVSQSTVNHIKRKRTWAWLTDRIDCEQ